MLLLFRAIEPCQGLAEHRLGRFYLSILPRNRLNYLRSIVSFGLDAISGKCAGVRILTEEEDRGRL